MTQFEIIIPTEWGKDIFDGICKIMEEKGSKWAWALHEKDELSSFQHWHVGVTLPSSRTVKDVLLWFKDFEQIKENSIERIKKHWKTYLCYILHKTKDAIEKGKTIPTEYGGNADFDGALASYESKGLLDNLIADILDGKVRQYDYFNNKELQQAVLEKGWFNKVMHAFDSFTKGELMRSSTRTTERKQCWIFGKAGSGKTELAKWLCRASNYRDVDIYVTSSGNNPFDDYNGQPCIIVDDVDAETMSPKTMLKLADCFTGSAVKARYQNKVILADMVVFTSTIAPSNWWKAMSNDKVDGNVYQLLRRLNLGTWHIDGRTIGVTLYDGSGEFFAKTEMDMPEEVLAKVLGGDSQAEKALEYLGTMFNVRTVDKLGNKANVSVNLKTGDVSGKIDVPWVDDTNAD